MTITAVMNQKGSMTRTMMKVLAPMLWVTMAMNPARYPRVRPSKRVPDARP